MPEMSGRREKFDFSSYTPIAIGDKWPLIQHLMVAKYRTNSQNITFKTLNVKQSPSTNIPLTATLLKTCLNVVLLNKFKKYFPAQQNFWLKIYSKHFLKIVFAIQGGFSLEFFYAF